MGTLEIDMDEGLTATKPLYVAPAENINIAYFKIMYNI